MDEKGLSKLKVILESGELIDRLEALKEISYIDNTKANSLLFSALSSDSWHLRDFAAKLVGSRGEKVVDKLISMLKSEVWYVRASVAQALGYTGSLRAVKPLLNLLEDRNLSVRDNVVGSLRKIIEENGWGEVENKLSEEEIEKLKGVIEIYE